MASENRQEINILMLGETGVGKSTFINAFANYLKFNLLEEAQNEKLIALIPTSFTVMDDNYQEKLITFGPSDDKNECQQSGQSATQACKSYEFLFQDHFLVRIIDTPGVGDTRGVEMDKKNFSNVLSFINQYEYLHAICILMKPNNARFTTGFEFCFKQLLCQLDRSASKNIIFVFTHTRSTFYRPAQTLTLLKKLLKNIKDDPPFIDIPTNDKTIFCFDNESFRFLISALNGISFTEDQINDLKVSWTQSTKECFRLIQRIIGGPGEQGLEPHMVQNTTSLNEARRLIEALIKPLVDVLMNLDDNVNLLDHKKKEMENNENSIKWMKEKLYVPHLQLITIPLPKPSTICAHEDCSEKYEVHGAIKYRYKRICHENCYLQNIGNEILGPEELRNCQAFKNSCNEFCNEFCNKCSHHYKRHMHVNYITELKESKIIDSKMQTQIDDEESAKIASKKMIEKLRNQQELLIEEQKKIVNSIAKFSFFFERNSLITSADAFEGYFENLIENEYSLNKKGANNELHINKLVSILNYYRQKKDEFNKHLIGKNGNCLIKTEHIMDEIDNLYQMEFSGKQIKEIHEKELTAKREETVEMNPPVQIETSVSLISKFTNWVKKIWEKK